MTTISEDRAAGLSYGERAVGLTFNPSGDDRVAQIKRLYAQIIDLCHDYRSVESDEHGHAKVVQNEQNRLFSVAITEAQSAQMWAVKALTWKE